jgi:hypothetical protein
VYKKAKYKKLRMTEAIPGCRKFFLRKEQKVYFKILELLEGDLFESFLTPSAELHLPCSGTKFFIPIDSICSITFTADDKSEKYNAY